MLMLSGFLTEYGVEALDKKVLQNLRRERNREFFSEARGYFDELIGILTIGAVRKVSMVASKNAILRDLRYAQKFPRAILTSPQRFCSQAIALIASCYRRSEEARGIHWYDLTEGPYGRPPKGVHDFIAQQIVTAAKVAEHAFLEETKNVRKSSPHRLSSEWMAHELRKWMVRFKEFETLSPKFANPLLEEVLPPTNRLIREHGGNAFSLSIISKLICQKQD